MSRRQENVRKACNQIEDLAFLLMIKHGKVHYENLGHQLIKLAHRIKRTTWRGESDKSKSGICLSHSLSKRLNTNQTTTANIDVSTIPYY